MTRAMYRKLLAATAIATMPGIAAGASFQLLEQSPARLGNAFAGTASTGEDATTVFFNPAAMALLKGSHLAVGGNAIQFAGEFDDGGETDATGPEGEFDESAFVPNVYYLTPLHDRVTLGLGVNAPFGLSTDYGEDWRGRYHATNSELAVANFNSTLALEVSERLSLGVGVNYQTIDATLENEVDSFAACADAISPGACSTAALTPGARTQDSSATIEGDDAGVGVDLSLLYRVADRTRVGVIYRQGIDYTLEGEADFEQSAECQNNGGCSGALDSLEGDIEADLELPDVVTLSVTHGVNDAWTLHSDLAWTRWSSIERIEVDNTENGQNVSTLELDYEDTLRYAVGASYAAGASTWRIGVAYDESPQTDAESATPRIPDADRTWLNLGYSLALSDDASIDIGYAHAFVDEVGIDNESQDHRLQGEFDVSADIVAVQGNWRF